jgi:hypothetical protein
MRYAQIRCSMTPVGDGKIEVTGPYYDRPGSRTVTITVEGLRQYGRGAMIQNAFPELSADDREFLISGMSPEGWDSMCGSLSEE